MIRDFYTAKFSRTRQQLLSFENCSPLLKLFLFPVLHNPLCLVLQTLLPSPFLPDDATQLLEKCLKNAGRSSAHVFCGSIVVSEKFIEQCVKPFEKLMQEKAEKVTFIKYMSASRCTLYSITKLRSVCSPVFYICSTYSTL